MRTISLLRLTCISNGAQGGGMSIAGDATRVLLGDKTKGRPGIPALARWAFPTSTSVGLNQQVSRVNRGIILSQTILH